MNLRAQLQGVASRDNRMFSWNLIFTPVKELGVLAASNRWTVNVNRVTGEIVFDRNGLYIRASINAVAIDELLLSESEKAVISIFYSLLRTYPEDEYVTVSMEFLVDDDDICRYLLSPVLTVNLERFTVTL